MVVKLGDCVKLEDLFKAPKFGGKISPLYDKITGGAIKGQVHLFAAGSGVGKTRTGVSVCCELLKQGWSVGYLTFEQTKEQIAELIIKNFDDDAETGFELCKDLPCYIRRFENSSVESVINILRAFKGYDAVIFDYLALPEEAVAESFNASVTGLRFIKKIKDVAEQNNQFIFCLAQAKNKEAARLTEFASTANIWISQQLVNPVEVAVIANRAGIDLLQLDFIKVRYPRGHSRCRVIREFDFKHCKGTDLDLLDETGGKVEDGMD